MRLVIAMVTCNRGRRDAKIIAIPFKLSVCSGGH